MTNLAKSQFKLIFKKIQNNNKRFTSCQGLTRPEATVGAHGASDPMEHREFRQQLRHMGHQAL